MNCPRIFIIIDQIKVMKIHKGDKVSKASICSLQNRVNPKVLQQCTIKQSRIWVITIGKYKVDHADFFYETCGESTPGTCDRFWQLENMGKNYNGKSRSLIIWIFWKVRRIQSSLQSLWSGIISLLIDKWAEFDNGGCRRLLGTSCIIIATSASTSTARQCRDEDLRRYFSSLKWSLSS